MVGWVVAGGGERGRERVELCQPSLRRRAACAACVLLFPERRCPAACSGRSLHPPATHALVPWLWSLLSRRLGVWRCVMAGGRWLLASSPACPAWSDCCSSRGQGAAPGCWCLPTPGSCKLGTVPAIAEPGL